MTQELKNLIHARADAVQRQYHQRGPLFRVLWLIAAILVIVAGLAMLVFPGPAVIVIPLGIAMLAARFRWAQVLLRTTVEHGVALHRRFAKASLWVRVLVGLAGAAVVGALALLVLR